MSKRKYCPGASVRKRQQEGGALDHTVDLCPLDGRLPQLAAPSQRGNSSLYEADLVSGHTKTLTTVSRYTRALATRCHTIIILCFVVQKTARALIDCVRDPY